MLISEFKGLDAGIPAHEGCTAMMKVREQCITPLQTPGKVLFVLQLSGAVEFRHCSEAILAEADVIGATQGLFLVNRREDGSFFKYANGTLKKIMDMACILRENQFPGQYLPIVLRKGRWLIDMSML